MNLTAPKQTSRHNAAFTLVEALVGLAVVGTVFFSLYSGISMGFGIIKLARESVRATQILQEKMEIVRLYNWEQINSTNYVPRTFEDGFDPTNKTGSLIYSGTILISNAPISEAYRSALLEVTAEIHWNSGGITRQRSITTFVSRYGMQNYLF